MHENRGALRNAGVSSFNWSRLSSLEIVGAYSFDFYSSAIYPSADSGRYLAFLVRHDFSNSHSRESLKMYKQG